MCFSAWLNALSLQAQYLHGCLRNFKRNYLFFPVEYTSTRLLYQSFFNLYTVFFSFFQYNSVFLSAEWSRKAQNDLLTV